MAGGIFSGDDYMASQKDDIGLSRTASRVAVAGAPFTVVDLAGSPGTTPLAVGNTANGVVPTDADAAYPLIKQFAAGAVGCLSKVMWGNSVACRIVLYDRLFAAGEYAFNDNINLAAQPSFAARVPNADYNSLEMWFETTVAFTGIPTVTAAYTNAIGTAGRSTGAVVAPAAMTLGRMMRMPLAAGDGGIQKLEGVSTAGTAATAGKFNLSIMRKLGQFRVKGVSDGGALDLLGCGAPRVYQNSALFAIIIPDSTATGLPDLDVQIASY